MMKKNYFNFKKGYKFLLLGCLQLAVIGSLSAQIIIKGTVTSEEEPLIGVNILEKGTSNGTITDLDGNYSVSVANEDAILVFSYTGYKDEEVAVRTSTIIDLVMKSDAALLDEVVVIGYGEQSRTTLSTSVSSLNKEVLENIPYANSTSALIGSISGLRVQTTSGQPGQAPRVILRGGTSITSPNGSSPLYIIDGVIRDNMNDLNPADIESIDVLKDAAATAIYGARASNGIILVTTKKGKPNESRINYSYSYSTAEPTNRYDFLGAADYFKFSRQGFLATNLASGNPRPSSNPSSNPINDLTNNTAWTPMFLTNENRFLLDRNDGWEVVTDPVTGEEVILKGTNWQDVLFDSGISQNHNISLSGGADRVFYNVSFGYLDAEGIAINTDYKRYSGIANLDFQVRDNISAFAKVSFSSRSDNQVFNVRHIFQRGVGLPETGKFRFEDGTLSPGWRRSIGNIAYQLDVNEGRRRLNRTTLVAGGNWEIIDGLSFKPSFSLYGEDFISNAFTPFYYDGVNRPRTTRNASADFNNEWRRQLDATLDYSKSIEGHTFNILGGVSWNDQIDWGIEADARGAATDLVQTLNASAEPTNTSSEISQSRIISFFGRVTYDFNKKYLLSASIRRDGSSRLGDDFRFGYFPGVSVGWNIHNESFNLPAFVNTLKLRASYGASGNISGLSEYFAQGSYSVNETYNQAPSVLNVRPANPTLRWESSKTVDFGFDAGLFNNKVNVIFDFYRKVTDQLLTNFDLPQSTGFASLRTNLGSLENKGVEIELSATPVSTRNGFQWNTALNASFNKSKILKLPDNPNDRNRIGGIQVYDQASRQVIWVLGLQEGATIGEYYTFNNIGIYATDEAASEAPIDIFVPGSDKTRLGGDVIFEDLNSDGMIDGLDRVYAGNRFPTWVGGFTNSVSYKNFSLLLRTDFTLGHTIKNRTRATFNGQFQGNVNATSDILRSWQNQGDVTDIPRYYWADQLAHNQSFRRTGDAGDAGSQSYNSYYYEKGDFLSIRELTLSYTFPSFNAFDKIGLSNLRINLTGQNLHYFTGYKGLIPEDGGEDNGRYPNARTYIIGVNVTF